MSGNIISAILKGRDSQKLGHPAHFGLLMVGLSAGGCVIEMLMYYGEPVMRLRATRS